MKNIVLLLLMTAFTVNAQQGINMQLKKFTKIKAYDQIEVKLIKSSENKLVITGEDKDEVSISNKNGLLKIKMEFDNQMDGKSIEVEVYYTENLTLIDSNENAKIKSDDTLTGSKIKVAAQEAGKIMLTVNIENLEVKSTSGGQITLLGKAANQIVIANTGGKVFNKKLKTKATIVTVNAGGNAAVNASQNVEAKVRAGGVIEIYGNPKHVEKNKIFGGKIKVIN